MNVYGLIGFPLGHSFSKKYFTEKFEREGINESIFELFPLESVQEFSQLLKDQPLLKGLAVTIPYKQSVITYLNELSEEARTIGAVNCILFYNGKLKGYNTDAKGFHDSFTSLLPHGSKKALVLGNGGSARAVMFVLNKLNIRYNLVSRKKSPGILGYEDLSAELMKDFNIIINCSPVGMSPDILAIPAIPLEGITAGHYCYDLIYTPTETAFLYEARMRGAVTSNGLEMLKIQAEENWRIWNETT